MALFQISEPDSPALERVIGIDLGTTHSLVAIIENGVPKVLADDQGKVLLPSAVAIDNDKQVCVGYDALKHPMVVPATSFKRWIGRAQLKEHDHKELQLHENRLCISTPLGMLSAVDFSAYVLHHLKLRAEAYWGDTVQGAVITVPAYFDEAQRQATKEAAEQAGLRVLRLLNEPTAAAIAYSLDERLEGTYAVYDLGGGTFDLSVLKLRAGIFEVLSTAGNIALGGDDFDRVLAEHLLPEIAAKGWSASTLYAMRRVKEILTTKSRTGVGLGTKPGAPFKRESVTAAEFQEWTQYLVDQTFVHVRRALKDAGLQSDQLDGIVLVGGATRMPHVRATVERFFSRPPLTNLDPDQVVALGAARQAMQLAQSNQDWLLLDVTPLSLGIEMMGGLVEKIIPRNTTLPVSRAQEFTTFQDGQTALKLHVVQGERESVQDCRSLAKFILRGIPPMAAGVARIRVVFQIDADGLLSVSAKELTTGVEAAVTVRPSDGIAEQDVQQRLREATEHAAEDMQVRRFQEAHVEAQRVVYAVEQALMQDGHRIVIAEKVEIERLLGVLKEQLNSHLADADQLMVSTRQLEEASHHLALRKMDAAIAEQLEGHSVDEMS